MIIIKKIFPFLVAITFIGMAIYQFAQVFQNWEKIDLVNDMVMKWDSRVEPLRNALPSVIKQVGYIDNLNAPAIIDYEELFLMQYALAPAVIIPGAINETWIIGNFDDTAGLEVWLNKNIGNYEIKNFGFGLYLIKKIK